MLLVKSVAQIQIPDVIVNRVQQNIANAVNPVLITPIIDGILVKGVNVSATAATPVKHGLGRTQVSQIVVNSSPGFIQVRQDPTAPSSQNYVTLLASSTGVIDLWIF